MSLTEFGADVKSSVPSHISEATPKAVTDVSAAAAHPVMAAAADHPAVKVAAASHPAVAALIATHPAIQAAAPHVSNAAAAHADAQGGPAHPAVAANHPAVEKAIASHPAVAAVIASHPHVVAHNPDLARSAAAHAEKHGWSPHDGHILHHDPSSPWYRGWGVGGGGFLGGIAASHYWPWHWGTSRPGAPVRHHWLGRLRGWWTGEPVVYGGYDESGLSTPDPGLQGAAFQAVDDAGDTGGLAPDDLDDSGSGEGGGAGTNSSISG
jgi:hypothetical protein